MTGRDLIIYILQNNLEDKPVCDNGSLLGFLTVEQAAAKLNVGTATVGVWVGQDMLDCIVLSDKIYIPANAELKIDN